MSKGLCDRFGFGVDLEFFVDVSEVKRNGVDADVEVMSRSLVAVSFDQHLE